MKKLVIGTLLLSACSFDAGEAPASGTPWDLEDTGTTDTNNDASNNGASNNGGTNNANTNNANTNNTNTNNTNTNNTNTNNTNTNNTNNSTNDTTTDMGTEPPPDGPCGTNVDCGGSQTCCPQRPGVEPVCQDRCLVGGLCADDNECSNGEKCCDLSSVGIQDKLCSATCLTNSGGTSCDVTTDCPGTQVCCSGRNGATCADRCIFGGGACETNADCKDNNKCCEMPIGDDQCLSRCR